MAGKVVKAGEELDEAVNELVMTVFVKQPLLNKSKMRNYFKT